MKALLSTKQQSWWPEYVMFRETRETVWVETVGNVHLERVKRRSKGAGKRVKCREGIYRHCGEGLE